MTAALVLLLAAAQPPAPPAEPVRTVTVSAVSVVEAPANVAALSVTVETKDPESLPAALAKNDAVTADVLAAFAAAGLTEADYQIADLDLGPRYARRTSELVGFAAKREWDVRAPADRFPALPELLGAVIGSGATGIDLTFQLDDQRPFQVEARRLAVELARTKASHLAELTGATLGRALRIDEDVELNSGLEGGFGGGAFSVPADSADGGQENAPETATPPAATPRAGASPAAVPAPALTPGVIRLTATVHIVWELTDGGPG